MSEQLSANRRTKGNNDRPADMKWLNLLILSATVLIVFVICGSVVTRISRDASMRLAHAYSLEATSIFEACVAGDLALLRLATQSTAVQEWFADDTDESKKKAAHADLMTIAPALQSMEYYAGMINSLNQYAFDANTSYDEIVPNAPLEYGNPWDLWFFDLLESDIDYDFNVDVDRASRTWRVWVNHKVFSDGEVVGILCTPVGIEEILQLMFRDFESGRMVGYVVDTSGSIHMDSETLLHYTELDEGYVGDAYDLRVDISSVDAQLGAFINDFVKQRGRWFVDDAQPETIAIETGYASVAPIANSDWMVITVYDSNALFSVLTFLPILIAMVASVSLYAVMNFVATKRFVVKPLETEAYIDELTGVSTRRHFTERADAELQKKGEDSDFSVILFDVDNFKKINDTYGHSTGDEVLRIVALRAQRVLKEGTLMGRYGGEEFAVALPGNIKAAESTAERIRKALDSEPFAIEGHSLKVTASFGTASSGPDCENLEMLIGNADRALYIAKYSGKNRVVVFSLDNEPQA